MSLTKILWTAAFLWALESVAVDAACPTVCVPNSGYPWPACGCLNATDLNTAIASRAPLAGDTFTGGISFNTTTAPSITSGGLTIWNTTAPRSNATSWIDTLLPGTQTDGAYAYLKNIGMLTNISLTGEPAIVGASRSGNTPVLDTCCAMGLTGVAVNDNIANAQTAWPLYATGARIAGTGAVQIEFSIANVSSDVVDITPYAGTTNGPPGSSVVLNLGAGGEPPQVGNLPNGKLSAFVFLNNNGSKARKGVVVGDNALDTALGGGGNGVALELSSGQSVRWLKSDGTTLGEAWATNSGIHVSGKIINTGAPTSCSGAVTGTIANVSGTATFCP